MPCKAQSADLAQEYDLYPELGSKLNDILAKKQIGKDKQESKSKRYKKKALQECLEKKLRRLHLNHL